MRRFGDGPGNGYAMCSNLMGSDFVLLNFGLTKGDQFGCKISSDYAVMNYLYICSCEKDAGCRDNNNKTVVERVCLSEMSEVNREHTFTSVKDEIDKKGLKGRNIVLKMDVEGAEWMALKTLPL